MKFLVLSTGITQLPDTARLLKAQPLANKYRKDLLDRGKLIMHAHIAGYKAHMWVYDVESVDELDRLMSDDPMSFGTSPNPQIYALTSYERMHEREERLAQIMGAAPTADRP